MAGHGSTLNEVTRREFARLFALGGSAALYAPPAFAAVRAQPRPAAPPVPDEPYWASVRKQFLLPPELAVVNAANLCPSPIAVVDCLSRNTRDIDRDPSLDNRRKMGEGREATRRQLAAFLRVTPDEIVITRNTSEGNNIVSSGIDLKPGDEVVIFADNHPSAHNAFREKAKRFGFTVKIVEVPTPHPGAEAYVDAFARQLTANTRVLAFTHVTASVGDLLPARELCRMARERGVLTLVDAAQSFGVLDIDLSDMQPDFFTGSAHKWPCGPREVGVLYINTRAQSKIWPSVISLYPGAVGISKTFEAFGQRDEAGIIAFGEALAFLEKIGRKAIETRSRQLAQQLIAGLARIDGVRVWTHPDPARSAAIVTFQPGTLDPGRLAAALYQKDRIACMSRGGSDRPGLRVSPHFYNLPEEIDRTVAAVRRYMSAGA